MNLNSGARPAKSAERWLLSNTTMCAKRAQRRRAADLTETALSLRTRADLKTWVRARLQLPAELEQELLNAVDQVLLNQQRLGIESKEHALQALVAGFAQRLDRMRGEVLQREATTRKIARYFEHLVDELTSQTRRDAKTHLLNFRGFMDLVEAALRLDHGEPWCALGMIDITAFKALNDRFGHAAGDRIIEHVAHLLRREVRDSDFVSSSDVSDQVGGSQLHGRFGGDEFCFFLPSLASPSTAGAVAERFSRAVAQQDWSAHVPGLPRGAVAIDVGVVCFLLGAASQRRGIVRQIADGLVVRADARLYDAKRDPAVHVSLGCVRLDGEELTPCSDVEEPTQHP